MTKKDKNTFLTKMTILSALMLDEMDKAKVDTEEAESLKKLLETQLTYAYEQPLLCSKPFLQTIEYKVETIIRKAAQENNIRL